MDKQRLVYSIDKIKLEFKCLRFQVLQEMLNQFSYSSCSDKYYTSNKISKCKHNFVIDCGGGVIYIGIEPNWNFNSQYNKSIVIEYNPNKIDLFESVPILKFLKSYPSVLIKVLSFDVAVDIPINYNLVRMLKRDVREKFAMFGSRHVETRYLGAMGHNHVKLYDKATEQKIVGDWTRFEITIKKINSLSATLNEFRQSINLPQVYFLNVQHELKEFQLTDIQRIVLDSIIKDTDLINTIKNIKTRKKYIKLINDCMFSVPIETNLMYSAYLDYSLNFRNNKGLITGNKEVDEFGVLKHFNAR